MRPHDPVCLSLWPDPASPRRGRGTDGALSRLRPRTGRAPAARGVKPADALGDAVLPPDEGLRPSRPDRPGDADWETPPQPPVTSGKAVASVVLGVLSLLVCSVFAGVPAIILGALGLRDIGRGQGRVTGKGLAITGIVTGALSLLCLPVMIGLLLPAVQRVREAAARLQSTNNLKQIVLAMHSYQDAMGTFPPAATCDANGKPLLSWRVAILPYIEQASLYNQFKLDEPWDGPNNSKLLSSMPKIYLMPGDTTAPPGYTYYRVFVGHGAAFDPPRPAKGPNEFGLSGGVRITDFPDGKANTILVVEAGQAVPWTKPDELDYDPNGPLPPLGGHFSGVFTAALADGAVKQIPMDTNPQTIRAAITRNGGEAMPLDW